MWLGLAARKCSVAPAAPAVASGLSRVVPWLFRGCPVGRYPGLSRGCPVVVPSAGGPGCTSWAPDPRERSSLELLDLNVESIISPPLVVDIEDHCKSKNRFKMPLNF